MSLNYETALSPACGGRGLPAPWPWSLQTHVRREETSEGAEPHVRALPRNQRVRLPCDTTCKHGISQAPPSRMHKRPNEADCCPKAGGISSKSHRTCIPRNHGDLACTLRDAECHWTNHMQNLVLVRIFAYASQVWLRHASLRSQTASSVVTARRTDLGKLSALPRLRLSLTYTMVWQCQQTASAPSRNVFLA